MSSSGSWERAAGAAADECAVVEQEEGTVKVSGFTIVKNATLLEYPLVESILSILPIVDEYVVLIGKSEDDTVAKVEAIGSPKIRIVANEWNDTDRKDGLLFSRLTNLALAECRGRWAFYLQADEVIHENDLRKLSRMMQENAEREEIKAMVLRFRNFHGDYRTYNPYSHRRAARIVRNNGEVVSAGDAVGFCLRGHPERRSIQDSHPANVLHTGIYVYHYSWVKDVRGLVEKANLMQGHYFGDDARKVTEYELEAHKMKRFRGSHPKVMEKRISEFRSPFPPLPNRWLNPKFYLHVLRHGYKG
jgi:glycosyltransferase involved in cell wall biosynthesis